MVCHVEYDHPYPAFAAYAGIFQNPARPTITAGAIKLMPVRPSAVSSSLPCTIPGSGDRMPVYRTDAAQTDSLRIAIQLSICAIAGYCGEAWHSLCTPANRSTAVDDSSGAGPTFLGRPLRTVWAKRTSSDMA